MIWYSLVNCASWIINDLEQYTCIFSFFFNKDPEDFLLFNSVGYSLQQGFEAQRHVKAFEQINSAPIPTAGHPTYILCEHS